MGGFGKKICRLICRGKIGLKDYLAEMVQTPLRLNLSVPYFYSISFNCLFLVVYIYIADSTCTFPKSVWSKELYVKNDNTTLTKITFENSTLQTNQFSCSVYTSFSCFMKYESIYLLR